MTRETVSINKFVNGGFGLGQLPSGQILLVQHSLPGESVIVTTQETKKNYIFGKLVSVENEHPGRIVPPCPYYGECGGCNMQHCDYPTQTLLKKEIVIDLLERQKVLPSEAISTLVANTLEAPAQFGYRQRIRLQVAPGKAPGFHRYRSNEIIEIESCLIAKGIINDCFELFVQSEQSKQLMKLSTEIEMLHNPLSNTVTCIFHYTRKPRPADVQAARKICTEIEDIDRIFFAGETFPLSPPVSAAETDDNLLSIRYEKGDGSVDSFQLSWEVGGFCQVNLAQNQTMIDTVLDFSGTTNEDTVLDLYCGMGNFSIPLAARAKELLGIEGQGSSIRSAKRNGERAGLNNTTFVKQQVHKGCESLIHDKRCFDIVVIDPPRQGAPELAKVIANLCRKRLVYISCDPATLCRDLNALIREGFIVKKIQPIDMFPQTHHIETIVLLEK